MTRASITHVEYHLPNRVLSNEEISLSFPEWTPEKIRLKLGIATRHIAEDGECSSDLAVAAAQKLFSDKSVLPSEIDFILFCTQTPDYLLPTSACLIQSRLNISKSAGAFDFNLGCSGYVYGLGIAKGLIETKQATKILLLTGETYTKLLRPQDKNTRTIFGDAGSATVISAVESESSGIDQFVYGTDGHGSEHLIIRHGGARHPGPPASGSNGLLMNGGEIFTFSGREVSKAVDNLLSQVAVTIDSIDLFIFHQANSYMLDYLRTKCRIPEDKFYVCFAATGNTVSNTIPIALHHALREGRVRMGSKVVLVGFGVGFSWAACLVQF